MNADEFARHLLDALKGPRGLEIANAIADRLREPPRSLVLVHANAAIVGVVATYCGVGVDEILSRSKYPLPARGRSISMALCREIIGASYLEIGRLYERDHSTVIAACRRARRIHRRIMDVVRPDARAAVGNAKAAALVEATGAQRDQRNIAISSAFRRPF